MKPASLNVEPPPAPQPIEAGTEVPVWLQRMFLIVYVVICIELGIALVTLPWSRWWVENNLLAHWPSIRHFLLLGFVRGAISGLGFLDLWIGISEALHYRDRR